MTFGKKVPFTENKYFEFQTAFWEKDNSTIFNLDIHLNKRCDHAGLHFDLSVQKFYLGIGLYDNRHWDRKKDEWEKNE